MSGASAGVLESVGAFAAPSPRLALWPRGTRPAARLVRLRWLAVIVSALVVVVGTRVGIFADPLPLLAITLALAVFNTVWATLPLAPGGITGIRIQLLVDLTVLTLMLHFAGGVANPLVMLYLVHAILAAMLLPRWQSYMVAAYACLAFKMIAVGEMMGWFSHHALRLGVGGEATTTALATNPIYVMLLIGTCVGLMGTSVYFVSQVMEGLRARETALWNTRGQLYSAINSIQDGIVLLDGQGAAVACNHAMRGDDCLHQDDTSCGPGIDFHLDPGCASLPCWPFPGDAAEVIVKLRAGDASVVLSTEEASGDARFRHRLFPVDRERTGVSLVWVREDVTRQRRLEVQSRHQDRMAAVGLLAAGVAHEIRNPLASISAIVEETRLGVDDEIVKDDLGMVASQVHRISRILGELNGFAKPPSSERSPVDVDAVVQEALRIARFDPRSRNVTIVEDLDEALPSVTANRDQLLQVSLNLILNALEAMPDGGTLRVASARRGDVVEMLCQDTGQGIPSDRLEHVFTPFFTTKVKGEGAGLGLSVCANIVRAHGGQIAVESQAGAGSTFRVHLPLAPESVVDMPGDLLTEAIYGAGARGGTTS